MSTSEAVTPSLTRLEVLRLRNARALANLSDLVGFGDLESVARDLGVTPEVFAAVLKGDNKNLEKVLRLHDAWLAATAERRPHYHFLRPRLPVRPIRKARS